MRSVHHVALGLTLSMLVPSAFGADLATQSADSARLFDDFDGELSLDWRQIRPVTTHQSLTKSPGKLTITTQYGSIHRTGRPELAKNMFLIPIPEPTRAEFVVTTVLDGFQPQTPYNQAGLLIYKDDDNYLKFVCEFSSAGMPMLNVLLEQQGVSAITNLWVPFNLDRLWLRVTKRGQLYECSSSNDGKTFVTYADLTWNDAPNQVGILAKNGGTPIADEVEARFDSFELRKWNDEEKAYNAAQSERLALHGTWKVVSGQHSGKPMSNTGLTSVTIGPGSIVLGEPARTVGGTCVIDTFTTPKLLTVFVRSGTTVTRLNWAYRLNGDSLALCTTVKPNADAPDSLETKEGDGRMLLTLERTGMDE